jgi:hypothetical protein
MRLSQFFTTYLLLVMVPRGVYGGQTIRVLYPDGSGRQVEAKVPIGMATGSIFCIEADFKRHQNDKSCTIVHPITPNSQASPSPSSNCLNNSNRQQRRHTTNSPFAARPVSSTDPVPFSQWLDNIDPPEPQYNKQNRHSKLPKRDKARLLRVAVPPNAKAGSTIHVKIPSDDRFIATIIPPNCTEFHVQYEPKPSIPPLEKVPSTRSWYDLKTSDPRQHYRTTTSPLAARPVSSDDPVPFSQCLDDIDPLPPHDLPSSENARLLRVKVPPKAKAGSTIHVQIPGEHRFIAAEIPTNCREFHVQYNPNPESMFPPPPKPMNSRCPSWPLMHFPFHPSSTVSMPPSEGRQDSVSSTNSKLLLVQVPHGVTAGTKLRVQVPGEPGRVLSAHVPPGNIRKFHISYIPRI